MSTAGAVLPERPDRSAAERGWAGLACLEGVFNPVGQQRGGFLWIVARATGRGRGNPVIDALARGPINTNPVLAGYVAGALAAEAGRMHDAGARHGNPASTGDGGAAEEGARGEETVTRVREGLCPVLGAIGDRIFWGGVRPGVSLLGVTAVLLGIAAPAVWMWAVYNAVRLYWQRRSWSTGLAGEESVGRELRGPVLKGWAEGAARGARFLLGLVLGIVVTRLFAGQGWTAPAAFAAVCALGFLIARSGRVSPLWLGWIGLAAAGCLALARLGLEKGVH